MALQTAVKAMNDNIGSKGLVPSFLAFGSMPRYAKHRENHEAIRAARQELYLVPNEKRIKYCLKAKVPESADVVFEVGDLVRVFREDAKCYTEPKKVFRVEEGGMITVEESPGKERKPSKEKRYSASQMKKFEGFPKDADDAVDKVVQVLGPLSERYWEGRNDDELNEVHITEDIHNYDPRATNSKMK